MKSWDTTTIASLKSLTLGARVEWSEVWLRFCVERLSRYLDIELSDGCLENSGDCLESILLSNFNEHSFRTLFGIRCHSDKVEELFSERFEICKFTSFIAKYGARPLMTQYPNGPSYRRCLFHHTCKMPVNVYFKSSSSYLSFRHLFGG
jgi:hypothetical protein